MRRRPSPTLRLLALLCGGLSLAAAGCAKVGLFRPSRAVKADTVGVALPLSGPYAPVGQSALSAVRLAFQGSPFQLVVKDTRGEAAGAAEAAEALANEAGAIAVVGGVLTEEANALAERADALALPLVTLSKAAEVTEAGSYVFRAMPTLESQARAIAEYGVCELGHRSFAVLAPQTDAGRVLTEAFTRGVEDAGGSVVVTETYAPEQTTFTAEAQRLTGRAEPEKRPDYVKRQQEIVREEKDPTRRRRALEKLRKSLPPIVTYDALFLPDGWKTVSLIAPALAFEDLVTNPCDREDLERIRKTVGREKLPTARLLGWGGWSSPVGQGGVPELVSRGGKFLHCAVFVDGFFAGSSRPATRAFVSRFGAAQGGKRPDLLQAVAYDAGALLRQVLEKQKPTDAPGMRDGIEGLQGFEGATGPGGFDDDRGPARPPFVLEVVEGGLEERPRTGQCSPPTALRLP